MPEKTLKMIPTRRCDGCGGLLIVGAEKYHLCPGPKPHPGASVTVADGTRGMERGR